MTRQLVHGLRVVFDREGGGEEEGEGMVEVGETMFGLSLRPKQRG